jgi:ABC-type lipoprotein export system ATPase subunit
VSTATATARPNPAGERGGGAALVRCREVAKTFGAGPTAVVAVHSASCQVHPGERIAVVGPSGSGKSTLLHLMAGLEVPTAGEVSWPELGGPRGTPGRIGVVFQGPSLLPALDVAENVALPLVLAGVADRAAIELALRSLDEIGIGWLAAALPDRLSGGQAQRVAVARVLAGRPALVLADEPTGQLDRDTAAALVDTLLRVTARLGAAVVIATHDPAVAARLDRAWTMRDGRLRTTATTDGAGDRVGRQP